MSKTIKQLSDELSITKSALRHKIELLNLQPKLKKVGNQFIINDKQEKLIIDYLTNSTAKNNPTVKNIDELNNQTSENKTKNKSFTEKNTSVPSAHLDNITDYHKICSDIKNILETNYAQNNTQNDNSHIKQNNLNPKINSENNSLNNNLYNLYEILKSELAAKDLQISALTNQLSDMIKQNNQLTVALQNTTESLKSAQALHAGTIKQQLTEALSDNNLRNIKNTSNKKWWRFWK